MLLQARTAQLLEVHTELRRALYGRSSAMRSCLPTDMPLDVLRFLRLWDYEASLSAKVSGLWCVVTTAETGITDTPLDVLRFLRL